MGYRFKLHRPEKSSIARLCGAGRSRNAAMPHHTGLENTPRAPVPDDGLDAEMQVWFPAGHAPIDLAAAMQ